MERVVLAMSGGVDSSVAADLLLRQGYDVVGVFMRHGEPPVSTCAVSSSTVEATLPVLNSRRDHKQGCCSAADAADGRAVADRLGIPFYALNLRDDFGRIMDYFVDEYLEGRTPNPCVVCNQWLKFGKLFDYADSIDARYVATGHYARLEHSDGSFPVLRRGRDSDKDQSYVLFGVERSRLSRMLLPVGDYRKSEIRRMAAELGLRVADKRDSQEICFVTSGHHAEFVGERKGGRQTAGEIVTTGGQVVGTHDGYERFTIGQRRGLGVAMGEPYFVVQIQTSTNRVVIGSLEELGRRALTARQLNWLVDPPAESFRCLAQIRYNSQPQTAIVRRVDDDQIEVAFDEPCHGVAPGQAVVCYDNDRVLGGGWIE